jgi:hypothetical protein|tara:strand:+ start:15302 stop:16279 length:978 start_codon:yes stop_codon:yes gene_type:complete
MIPFLQFLEAKVLKDIGGYREREESIMYGDTIRVYHGSNNAEDIYNSVKYGTSGKSKVPRVHSYENDNNPKGIFVTSSPTKAKDFVGSGELAVVIELHANESDLIIPTWPNGGWTGYGGYSQYFGHGEDGDNEREKSRKASIEKIKKESDVEGTNRMQFVLDSDRPDLAYNFNMDSERQALFIGDLNPNSIRAIWVKRRIKKDYYWINDPDNKNYQRMRREEFIKLFESLEPVKYVNDDGYQRNAEKTKRFKPNSVFKPRDEWDEETFVDGISKEFGRGRDELFELLDDLDSRDFDELFMDYIWPRQEKKAREWWDNYGKDNPSK